VSKKYFVDQYAHVLKALAEGKQVYFRGYEAQRPDELLQVIYLGAEDPSEFSTEPPKLDIAIDAPVWAKLVTGWFPRHYAGYSDMCGAHTYWVEGTTSHSVPVDGYAQVRTCLAVSLTKPEGVK
jgi:hypothetical protein